MTVRPGQKSGGAKATFVQAVPLYLASDTEVARFFRDHRDEVDALTGSNIVIYMPREVEAGDVDGVAQVFEVAEGRKRYPDLKIEDLPCLWLEDDLDAHAVLKLPNAFDDIRQYVRALAQACRTTRDAGAIQAMVAKSFTEDAAERSPLMRVLTGEFSMDKAGERRLAFIFGVLFVTIILAIAIFITDPTPFQYVVFRIVLALAAAGFISMTPGFIEATVGKWVRAGGALAVFVVVYFFAPAALDAAGVVTGG